MSLVGIYLTRPTLALAPGLAHLGKRGITFLRFAFRGILGDFDASRPLDHGIVRTVWMSLPEIRASQRRHRSQLVLQRVLDFLAGASYPLQTLTSEFGPLASEPTQIGTGNG